MNHRQTSLPLSVDAQPSLDTLAKEIVYDAFNTQKRFPQLVVVSKLPIPMTKGSRKRVSRKLNVACDTMFHSAYDKAIHLIQTQ